MPPRLSRMRVPGALPGLLLGLLLLAFDSLVLGQEDGSSTPVAAARRVGLVIANSSYPRAADVLSGPLRDGATIKAALEKVNFRVTLVQDANKEQLLAAVLSFQKAVRAAGPTGIGLLYYAGHGAANRGADDNYLIPVDVGNVATADVAAQGVGVRWIIEQMQLLDERPAIVVVIDACRTTAAEGVVVRGGVTEERLSTSTLIEPDEPSRGYLVAFSTSGGRPASDSGHYADALADRLTTGGITLDQVFEQVRQQVAEHSRQLPIFRSALVEKVCLVNCGGAAGADALTTLNRAIEMRANGDVGQVAAVEELTRAGKSFSGLDMQGLFLASAGLDKAVFTATELDGVNLVQASLANADLSRAHLAFAKLNDARLTGANVQEALFYLAEADGADLSESNAAQSNWRGASLRKANFRNANLQGASLMLADLRGADFRGADLRGAFLIGALIEGARFDQALIENTDLSSALGSADQFSREEQGQLCASEPDSFRVSLMEVTKSDRFAGGEEFRNVLELPVLMRGGLRDLERCKQRTRLPAGGATIWSRGGVETISERMSLRFSHDVVEKGGRRTEWIDRTTAYIRMLNAAHESDPRVQVTGARHRELLQQLNSNVANAKLTTPARLDSHASNLFVMKYRPEVFTAPDWDLMAGQWVWSERTTGQSKPNDGRNHWQPFFPAGTSTNELTPDHVAAFKRWSLNRARQFPSIVTAEYPAPATALGKLQRTKAANVGDGIVIHPLADPGLRQQISPKGSSQLDASGHYLLALGPGWGGDGTVLRLPASLESHGLRISAGALEAIRKATPKLQMRFDVRGVDVKTDGDSVIRILDAKIIEMFLTTQGGERLP